jgi:hypothetical protein
MPLRRTAYELITVDRVGGPDASFDLGRGNQHDRDRDPEVGVARTPSRASSAFGLEHSRAAATDVGFDRMPRQAKAAATKKPRVYTISFASVYPLYLQKAAKKGRTKEEVDEVIFWLTGHRAKSLKKVIDAKTDLETFFAEAPRFHPNARLIKGVVCGVRVDEIEDETMRKIRYLDKLIDELAQGKAMEKILRS